jgi:hypothetical protein
MTRLVYAAVAVIGATTLALPAGATSLTPQTEAPLAALGQLAAPLRGYPPGTHLRTHVPHPAVARIIVPEGNATSYGSGTLVDVRDQFGLVVTNWHVVRDNKGDIEVVFPDGFRSKARPLKVDADWDLAALVIWRPPAPPVAMADAAPQSGDQLTICGYGQGQYRAVTGRCTQYYSPKIDLPQHMVELDVEARQGDSGGPIFNERGELAGVLFGAADGTTLGSFGGRVESFLATLAPDIGRAADDALVERQPAAIAVSEQFAALKPVAVGSSKCGPNGCPCRNGVCARNSGATPRAKPASEGPAADAVAQGESTSEDVQWGPAPPAKEATQVAAVAPSLPLSGDWTEDAKTVLAAIGALTLVVQVVRAVG